ncbi:MAG: fimbria major subunit [Muribaculaceae bacterium]
MRKTVPFLFSTLLGMSLLGGCVSTENVTDEPEKPSEKETPILKVAIATNDMTRSESSASTKAADDEVAKAENTISKLKLAFYRGNTQVGLVDAKKIDGSKWECGVPTSNDELPDAVIAYANLPESQELSSPLNLISQLEINVVKNGDNFIMSSAHYFDKNNENKKVLATSLSPDNFTDNAAPIQLNVERAAAKVQVLQDGFTATNLTVKNGVAVDDPGNGSVDETFTLILQLDGWYVSGVEKSSYLVKNLSVDYAGLQNELSGWTDFQKDLQTNWAHSKNYNISTFPNGNVGSVDGNTPYTYARFYSTEGQEKPKGFNDVVYTHETTLPKSNYIDQENSNVRKRNSLPSIVLVGTYKIEGPVNAPETFFKRGDKIYKENDYWTKMAFAQKSIFKQDGTPLSGDELKAITELKPKAEGGTYNMVTPQLRFPKEGVAGGFIRDNYNGPDGKDLASDDELNKALAISCGYIEAYKDGKCFFVVPVQHLGYKTTPDATGSYGLVRNHFYKISVKSIEGMGKGIANEGDYLLESEFVNDTEYNVSFNVNVVPWTLVEQDINIPSDDSGTTKEGK